VQNVRTAIKRLISTGELTYLSNREYSLFTIVNYDKYQELTYELTNDQQTSNKPPTHDQQQRKKANKANKEKEIKTYSDFDTAINDFIKFRKSIKKPMTDRAVSMLITKLDKLASDDETKIKILEQSIFKGWTDVYELKGGSNGQNISNNQQDKPGGYDTSKVVYHGDTSAADKEYDF
jgi:hypothetical protein